ncbi:MAG: flippase [Solirubrobacterales bacterium]|nr:flippase [Solirubrobacterales bacterium]
MMPQTLPTNSSVANACDSHAQHDRQMALVARGTLMVSAATFFGLGLNYIYAILLARMLGTGEFGLFSLALAVFNVLSLLALGGLDSAVLKFVTAHSARTDPAGARATVRNVLCHSIVLGTLFGSMLFLGSSPIAEQFFQKPELSALLILAAVGIPIWTTSSVLVSTLQALQKVSQRIGIKYVSEPLAKMVFTVLLFIGGLSAQRAFGAFILALALSVLLAFLALRILLPASPHTRDSPVSNREIMVFSLPLLGGMGFASLAARVDILLLGYWAATSEVGIYSAAFQTSAILALILGSLESVALPMFSEAIARNDTSGLQRLYVTVMRWALTGALPIFLIMIIFPEAILSLFGSQFTEGALCLIVLATGQIVNSATGTIHSLLLFAGHSKLVMWTTVSASLFRIVLGALLIPEHGMIGAAIAVASGSILLSVVRFIQCLVILKMQPYDRAVWKPLFSIFGAAVAMVAINRWAHVDNPIALMSVSLMTYLMLIVSLGLEKNDRSILLGWREKSV